MKIYIAAAVEALQKRERQDKSQFTTKIGGKTSLGPSYFVLYNFHSKLRVWCPIMLKLPVIAPWSWDFLDDYLYYVCKNNWKIKTLKLNDSFFWGINILKEVQIHFLGLEFYLIIILCLLWKWSKAYHTGETHHVKEKHSWKLFCHNERQNFNNFLQITRKVSQVGVPIWKNTLRWVTHTMSMCALYILTAAW